MLVATPAFAQDYPTDLDNTLVENQSSAEAVSSFTFVSPNSTRKGMRSLTARATAVGFVYLFDATVIPSNGAVTPCASSATARPCYMWCVPVAANGFVSATWDSPLKFTSGITAVYSSTGCASLTASATAQFFGQAP